MAGYTYFYPWHGGTDRLDSCSLVNNFTLLIGVFRWADVRDAGLAFFGMRILLPGS